MFDRLLNVILLVITKVKKRVAAMTNHVRFGETISHGSDFCLLLPNFEK